MVLLGRKIRQIAADYWGAALIVLFPPMCCFLLLWAGLLAWAETRNFLVANWGNVASVWGLTVGIYVLVVSKGAKRAAQEVRDRESQSGVLRQLELAAHRIQELGLFAKEGKWDLVYFRGLDVLGSCRAALAGWVDDPGSEDRKNELNSALTITRSIVTLTAAYPSAPMDDGRKKRILSSHLRIHDLLATIIGYVEKKQREADER